MKQTESINPLRTFMDTYVFSQHDYKHIRHVKYPNGNVLVLDAGTKVEMIKLKRPKPIQVPAPW